MSLPHARCPLRSPQVQSLSEVHALTRANVKGDRPDATEQSIPSYIRFHAGLNMEQAKSKACFHMSNSQPPNKSVVNDTMDMSTITIASKRMHLAFLVGDHLVNVLITLLKYGWLSILQKGKQLLVHSRYVNNVSRIRASHNVLANRKDAKRKHMECGPKPVRNDEQCVQDLVKCMHEFDSFPFDPASPTLPTLQSAMLASGKLVADFNSARAAGEETLTSFLRERVFSKNASLHASVHLRKRLAFAKEPGEEARGGTHDESC